jgi:hypothetical protein
MLRTLRAFAWMRWRVLLNSLERTGARDSLERFSLAVDQLGPIIAALLLVPSALGLAGLSAYAGYWLAAGTPAFTFQSLRILLLLGCVFAVFAPLLLPSMDPTAIVRLLLLPIRQTTLYAAQAVGALSEPWVLLSVPVVIALPIGLAAGGAGPAAIITFLAGILFLICLVGLSTLSALLLHLVVRDRRRGELFALLFIMLVPALSVLPTVLMQSQERPPREHRSERPPRARGLPPWISRGAAVANVVAPSELFARTARAAAQHKLADAPVPLALLVVIGGALHGFGLLTFSRLLKSPQASGGARRASTAGQGRALHHLPGLPRASGAVALAQVRLALRTPRGRSILLSPLIVFTLVAIVMHRQGDMDIAGLSLADGFNLAMFGSAVSILAIQPFAMNQFAVDRAGLTMALLAPLRTIDLLVGKAVGLALIAAGPAFACCAIAAIFVGGGTPSLWLTLPLVLAASYLLLAPASAMLSALFPRTVDLNSIGRAGNPHGVASFLGMLLFAASMVPPFLIVAAATQFFGRPELAPIGMLVWCGLTFVASRILFSGAAAIFDKRRENLGLVGT